MIWKIGILCRQLHDVELYTSGLVLVDWSYALELLSLVNRILRVITRVFQVLLSFSVL